MALNRKMFTCCAMGDEPDGIEIFAQDHEDAAEKYAMEIEDTEYVARQSVMVADESMEFKEYIVTCELITSYNATMAKKE